MKHVAGLNTNPEFPCRLAVSFTLAAKRRVIPWERRCITIPKYTIFRVYEIEAESSQHATDRMAEAIVQHTEQAFHVKDILRQPGEKPGQGTTVELHPARWLASVRKRLGLAERRVHKAAKRYFDKA